MIHIPSISLAIPHCNSRHCWWKRCLWSEVGNLLDSLESISRSVNLVGASCIKGFLPRHVPQQLFTLFHLSSWSSQQRSPPRSSAARTMMPRPLFPWGYLRQLAKPRDSSVRIEGDGTLITNTIIIKVLYNNSDDIFIKFEVIERFCWFRGPAMEASVSSDVYTFGMRTINCFRPNLCVCVRVIMIIKWQSELEEVTAWGTSLPFNDFSLFSFRSALRTNASGA